MSAKRYNLSRLPKLSMDDWVTLCHLMENVPDPDTTYTATGWHYKLMAPLATFGYKPTGRYEAYKLGVKLVEKGPREEKRRDT
jgi:hypothetical protein